MHVHFAPGIICPEVPPGWTSTQGEEPDSATQVLVHWHVLHEWLDRGTIHTVILPYAGLPKDLCRVLASHLEVALYNLHFHSNTVAELALSLLLAAARGVCFGDRKMREGRWLRRHIAFQGATLNGKRAVIFGYGAIGRDLSRMLKAMGCEVVGVRINPDPGKPEEKPIADLDIELQRSHILAVTAPLTPETEGIITFDRLASLMAPRLVVNVGRAQIVEEQGLWRFLEQGLGFAGIDVWYRYPVEDEETSFPSRFDLQSLPNIVMSPHQGGNTDTLELERSEALGRLLGEIAAGRPPARCRPEIGY